MAQLVADVARQTAPFLCVDVEPTEGLRGAKADCVEELVPGALAKAAWWVGGCGAALAPWTQTTDRHDVVAQPEA